MKPWIVVAVDGLAASGKGTLSRQLARHFNLAYLDTGKLYRALTFFVAKRGRKRLYERDKQTFSNFLELQRPSDEELQSEFISRHTPRIASQRWARKFLFDIQREFAQKRVNGFDGVVLDGRDIGTVVCPDADVKLFVVADLRRRAERRFKQLVEYGEIADFEQVLSDLEERDKRDSERTNSPLTAASDAVLLDTSELTIDEAVAKAVSIIEQCRHEPVEP